jgi:hypothetical protein
MTEEQEGMRLKQGDSAMKWLKAGVVGALGSLVMFLIITLTLQTGLAPFNTPPSAAFLAKLNIPAQPLGLVVHFLYGIVWSVILVALFRERTHIGNGLGLAAVLWLIMMVVYSPIIGWGFFGVGGSGHELAADHPLWIGSPVKYIVASALLHVVYGLIIGWLNPVWIRFRAPESEEASREHGEAVHHA